MPTLAKPFPRSLGLRAGDLVEVRSEAEILATLDGRGRFDSLPFMPEMLQYCGRQFRVFKRADKLCDTIVRDGIRRMHDTVLLENLRCDGSAHGDCQAACTILWKEAWLTRVSNSRSTQGMPATRDTLTTCSMEVLLRNTRKPAPPTDPLSEYFSCQATELRTATSSLAWWDPRQYWRDIRSGNVGIRPLIRALGIWIFNRIQIYRGGAKYPFIEGKLKRTPALEPNLRPGRFVQLRAEDNILKTTDVKE